MITTGGPSFVCIPTEVCGTKRAFCVSCESRVPESVRALVLLHTTLAPPPPPPVLSTGPSTGPLTPHRGLRTDGPAPARGPGALSSQCPGASSAAGVERFLGCTGARVVSVGLRTGPPASPLDWRLAVGGWRLAVGGWRLAFVVCGGGARAGAWARGWVRAARCLRAQEGTRAPGVGAAHPMLREYT